MKATRNLEQFIKMNRPIGSIKKLSEMTVKEINVLMQVEEKCFKGEEYKLSIGDFGSMEYSYNFPEKDIKNLWLLSNEKIANIAKENKAMNFLKIDDEKAVYKTETGLLEIDRFSGHVNTKIDGDEMDFSGYNYYRS